MTGCSKPRLASYGLLLRSVTHRNLLAVWSSFATDIHETVAFLLLALCLFNLSTRIGLTEKAYFDLDDVTNTPAT